MELNIFNINLNMDNKNREDISDFIKELSDYFKKADEREVSILEQVQSKHNVTVMFRDKMYVQRSNILNNYANETRDKGTMYYIYNKDSEKDIYHLCICDENKSNVVIEAKREDLPKDVSVDTVLRKENGKYTLDIRSSVIVRKQIEEMIEKVLKEQKKYLEEQRIEGHSYEVGEIEKDRVWLYDITKDNNNGSEVIEEIDFPSELLNKVIEGAKVIYRNGNYETNI